MLGDVRPRVLAIVLRYGPVDLALACLRSLPPNPAIDLDCLVVENGPPDGGRERLLAQFPDLDYAAPGCNLGFSGGSNLGLRMALERGYSYALLLNEDAELRLGCLRALVDAAEANPRIGAIGPTILYGEAPDRIWSAGGVIDWRRGTTAMRGLGQPVSSTFGCPQPVDFLSGCVLLCRSAALERVGLLDERFFLYYEDTEWCLRARRAGFDVVHHPAAQAVHHIPLDGRASAPYVTYYMARNRLLFLRLAGAPRSTWLRALLFQDLRTLLSWWLRPRWRDKRAHRAALLQAWRDFAGGRFGARPNPWSRRCESC